jgi:hypothetical protein
MSEWHGAPIDRQEEADENDLEKQGAFTSIVREPAQNSTDNRVDKSEPVLMRFSIKTIPKAKVETYFGTRWVTHVTSSPFYTGMETEDGTIVEPADQNAIAAYEAYTAEDSIPVLVIEDYNTTGLAGDVTFYQKKTNTILTDEIAQNTFYWFLRTLGVSSHTQGRGGSWGLGKIAFPLASNLKTFFVVTTRVDESRYLAGQAKLDYRTVHEIEYHKMFYYANGHEGGKPHHWKPIDDPNEINTFVSDFDVQRSETEPGTSFVVPFPRNTTRDKVGNLEALKCGIVSNYALAITQGILKLEFVNEAGEVEVIDQTNLLEKIEQDEFAWDAHLQKTSYSATNPSYTTKERMSEQIALGKMVFEETIEADVGLELEIGPLNIDSDFTSQFRNGMMPERNTEEFKNLSEAYNTGKFIRIKVKVPTNPIIGDPKEGEIIVVLRQKTDADTEPYYYRSQISLPLVKDKTPHRENLSSIVFIGKDTEDSFAEMLRQAEGPAHLKWQYNAPRMRKMFNGNSGWEAVKFVRDLPELIVAHLSATSADAKPFMSELLSIKTDPGDGDGSGKGTREVIGEFMFDINDLDNNQGFKVSKLTDTPTLVNREFLLRIGYPKPLGINWGRKPDQKVMDTTIDISAWTYTGCEITQLKHNDAEAGKDVYPDRVKVKILTDNFNVEVNNLDKSKKAKLKFDQWKSVSSMKGFANISMVDGGDD